MADSNGNTGWMSDVQRNIALILIVSFSVVVVITSIKLVFSADTDTLLDVTKTLQAALVNVVLIALGFFFGSNMSKTLADAGQQRIVEKLTSAAPGTLPPTLSAPAPWWTKFTEGEKTAIAAEAHSDTRVNAFMLAAIAGAANADDLTYIVSKNLLTPERAAAIQV